MTTFTYGKADAVKAADFIRPYIQSTPDAGIVLGSGLGGLVDHFVHTAEIPYEKIPGFPSSTVVGHAGMMVAGFLAGKLVLTMAGRFHMYEGHDVRLAAFPARVMHELGIKTLIVSNAAGGVNRMWKPGDLMLIRDHINLMYRNPLIGPVEEGDTRFPDMSEAYSKELGQIAREVASANGIQLREGVYAGLLGPTFETPAEVRMLERIGADATGMSTIPEVIVARMLGMRVLGISCITNFACGITNEPITHTEVLETTDRVAEVFQALVTGIVARL